MSDDPYPLPYDENHLPFDERSSIDVWPNGAKLAVLFYIAPEEWEWDRIEHTSVRGHNEARYDTDRPSLSSRTTVKYGFDIGLRRLNEILQEHDQRITLMTTANAVQQHPEVIQDMLDAGHEIAGRTSFTEGEPVISFSEEAQRKTLEKSLESYDDVLGMEPEGWLGPGAIASERTVDLLTQIGATYHADLQDDELPYFVEMNGETMVEIPYRMTGNINDFYLFGGRNHRWTVEDALEYLTSTFDAHYRTASRRPLFFIYGTHPFVSGRADSGLVFEEFLEYVQSFDDVWVPTYLEMAEWWEDRFGDGYD